MNLIRQFRAEDFAAAKEAWSWVAPELPSLEATHATAFGDLFLRDGSGAFWFLDGVEGSLQQRWASGAELQAQLNTADGQEQYLLVGVVSDAAAAGLDPGESEVLSFRVPPVLGGSIDVTNLEVSDFVLALSTLGQIHQKVRELPPGTPITGVSIG